ncbi:MAG TPA: 30S ribosomal protein S6e [Candidatus Thermoplasmatota archaeon]|nr:30S ribosomal protein S6e [Candidatus Thermoplasmatota archaeon]
MVDFKVDLANPTEGKTYKITVSGQHANVLVRKKIGDEVDGMFFGLPGYKVKITGGSDKEGFPMRREVHGSVRKQLLVSDSVGFHPKSYPGERRKRSLRGNEISQDIVQINAKVTQVGPKAIPDLIGAKKE